MTAEKLRWMAGHAGSWRSTATWAKSCRAVLLVGLLFAGATQLDAQLPASAGVGIDHVILGVDDLDRGMTEFARRTGVAPVKGGAHPGRGTQNALVSLSDGRYLEILAPSHEAGVAADPRTAHALLTSVGWALHTNDLRTVVTNVRAAGFRISVIRPGARARPDGVMLNWQTADVSGAGLEGAPFFIQWGAGTPHPSTQSPIGCRLTTVAMTERDAAPLTKFLRASGVDVSVAAGAARRMRITLTCPSGVVTFE